MLRVLVLVLLAVLALAAEEARSQQYREARAAGVAEAEADLAAAVPCLLTFGMPLPGPALDVETGLPLRPIAGCLVDDGILGRAEGYNATVRGALAQHGALRGSLSPWRELIVDPAAHLGADPARPEPGVFHDPSGSHRLRFDEGRLALLDPTESGENDGSDSGPIVLQGIAPGTLALHWGPPGSGLVIAELAQERALQLVVIDLRRALVLHRRSVAAD